MKKKVTTAKSAGFCMGVSLALKKLDKAIIERKDKTPLFTLGPIIHNPQVQQRYKEKGVLLANTIDEVTFNSIVVIRAHGIPKEKEEELLKKQTTIIDATCPKVKKAQLLIEEQSVQNKTMLLFGEAEHPEVQGLLSYCRRSFVFENLQSLKRLDIPAGQYFLAAQTTQDRNEFYAIEEYIKNRLNTPLTVLDTICNATKNRQEEVIELAQKMQCIIVVGGKNSGNTRRLVEIASRHTNAFHVETANDLPLDEIQKYSQIGLTAGASTPQDIVNEIRQYIESTKTKQL